MGQNPKWKLKRKFWFHICKWGHTITLPYRGSFGSSFGCLQFALLIWHFVYQVESQTDAHNTWGVLPKKKPKESESLWWKWRQSRRLLGGRRWWTTASSEAQNVILEWQGNNQTCISYTLRNILFPEAGLLFLLICFFFECISNRERKLYICLI